VERRIDSTEPGAAKGCQVKYGHRAVGSVVAERATTFFRTPAHQSPALDAELNSRATPICVEPASQGYRIASSVRNAYCVVGADIPHWTSWEFELDALEVQIRTNK
jgi:hypothetical protein